MVATPINPSPAALAADRAIRLYQRYVSPRKGFACAYRLRRNGRSCSSFARQAVMEHGVIAALPKIRRRFKACAAAAKSLGEKRRRASQQLSSFVAGCSAPSPEATHCLIDGGCLLLASGCDLL